MRPYFSMMALTDCGLDAGLGRVVHAAGQVAVGADLDRGGEQTREHSGSLRCDQGWRLNLLRRCHARDAGAGSAGARQPQHDHVPGRTSRDGARRPRVGPLAGVGRSTPSRPPSSGAGRVTRFTASGRGTRGRRPAGGPAPAARAGGARRTHGSRSPSCSVGPTPCPTRASPSAVRLDRPRSVEGQRTRGGRPTVARGGTVLPGVTARAWRDPAIPGPPAVLAHRRPPWRAGRPVRTIGSCGHFRD